MASATLSIEAVVFDLDGTLIDASATIAGACNQALLAHGFSARSRAEIKSFVGEGATRLMASAADLPDGDPRVGALTRHFVDAYRRVPCEGTELLPGAKETLGACSRFPLALCTNKPRVITEAVLAGLMLDGCFAAVNAGGDQPERKPAPEPLLKIAETLGIDPRALLMVGDDAVDIECGRRAGARTVLLPSQFGSPDKRPPVEADAVLGQLFELPALIAAWSSDSFAGRSDLAD